MVIVIWLIGHDMGDWFQTSALWLQQGHVKCVDAFKWLSYWILCWYVAIGYRQTKTFFAKGSKLYVYRETKGIIYDYMYIKSKISSNRDRWLSWTWNATFFDTIFKPIPQLIRDFHMYTFIFIKFQVMHPETSGSTYDGWNPTLCSWIALSAINITFASNHLQL